MPQPTTDEADLDWMMSLDLDICTGRQDLVIVNTVNRQGIDNQETAEGNEGDDEKCKRNTSMEKSVIYMISKGLVAIIMTKTKHSRIWV